MGITPRSGGSADAPDGKFDPLRLDILSQNLREALDARPRTEFPPKERFAGAGLYALYYRGQLGTICGPEPERNTDLCWQGGGRKQ